MLCVTIENMMYSYLQEGPEKDYFNLITGKKKQNRLKIARYPFLSERNVKLLAHEDDTKATIENIAH